MFCPSKLTDVAIQMQDNLKTVLQSLTLMNAPEDLVNDVMKQTTDAPHVALASQLPTLLMAAGINPEPLEPILNFLNSPVSGILVGALGPFLAPFVALGNSIGDGDSFSEIIANTIGAFFNGTRLDLDALLPLLNTPGLLPLGVTVQHLDVALGGLFSAGSVQNGPWDIYDGDGNVFLSTPAVGGSLGNSLGIVLAGPSPMDVTSQPIGPLGAWQGLSELIGLELGTDWNGKTGSFAKIPAFPPGVGLPPPTIPDLPTSDAGDAGAAVAGQFDASDLLNEFGNDLSNWFSL